SDRLAAAAPAGLGHVVVTLGATGAGERNERLRAVAGLAYKDVPVPHRRRTPGAVGPAHDDPPLCLYLRITNRISVLLAPCSSQSACRPSTGCRRCRGTQRAYLPSRKSTTAPSWRCLRTTWHTTPSSRPRRTRCPALTVFISPPYVSRSRAEVQPWRTQPIPERRQSDGGRWQSAVPSSAARSAAAAAMSARRAAAAASLAARSAARASARNSLTVRPAACAPQEEP